jgi:hypothetical protein
MKKNGFFKDIYSYMISKDYQNRIKSLSNLITESKADVIVDKIGFPKYVAEDMEDRAGKYSIWLANALKEHWLKKAKRGDFFYEGEPVSVERFEELWSQMGEKFQDIITGIYQTTRDQHSYVLDWLKGRNSGPVIETDKLDFKKLSFTDAHKRSFAWHRELSKLKKSKIIDEHGDVVMQFPDGYYWIRLNASQCDDEAQAMGHCGRGSGTLYSLRKNQYPSVTADINEKGIVNQMRGRANTKPKSTYHPYIFEFIMSDFVKGFNYGWRDSQNFWISDLEKKSDIDRVLKEKPYLFKDQDLSALTDEQGEYLMSIHPEYFKISQYFEGELSTEKVEKGISDLNWWRETLEEKIKNSYSPIDVLIKDFKGSSQRLSNILLKELSENDEIQSLLFLSKGAEQNQRNLTAFVNAFGEKGEEMAKKAFLNKTKVFVHYWNNGNIMKYISTIMKENIFGEDGPKKAYKLLKNDKIKKRFIKENDEETYQMFVDILEDELEI